MLATDYPLLGIFWTMFWFFCFVLWIWLIIWLFLDIMRSDDLSGWAKALWVLFIVCVPLIGAVTYLIVRGHSIQARAEREAEAEDQAIQTYARSGSNGSQTSKADEISKLAHLRAEHLISQDEFDQAKAKVLR